MAVRSWIALASLTASLALAASPQLAVASAWGSSYGDPAGFCPAQSGLPYTYRSLPATNDPLVGNNPERDTFSGWHADPGYDDWFGRWYGDFRGRPGDDSGWVKLFTIPIGSIGHWNFSSYGWAVHGHAKQYIAYYNWTFGGQCGMGWYGSELPAPYMADVDGYPVVDIYVDAVPPADPQPRISSLTPGSISFTWDPVPDRGDGAGADYFAVGFDHYTSWLTIDGGAARGRQDSPSPLHLTAQATPANTVCLFVSAADKLGNTTAPQSVCGSPAGSPPPPPWPAAAAIRANPQPGLSGLPAWFWLDPTPATVITLEVAGGITYRVLTQPRSADWAFGDGSTLNAGGLGLPYPATSDVQHAYDALSAAGYPVAATVNYSVSWWWLSGQRWNGPFPLPGQSVPAAGFAYPVRQAQPELQAGP